MTNYTVGVEHIGKLVRVDGKKGYYLLSIRHDPSGLMADVTHPKFGAKSLSLRDITPNK
jgi:hypothetical protein